MRLQHSEFSNEPQIFKGGEKNPLCVSLCNIFSLGCSGRRITQKEFHSKKCGNCGKVDLNNSHLLLIFHCAVLWIILESIHF